MDPGRTSAIADGGDGPRDRRHRRLALPLVALAVALSWAGAREAILRAVGTPGFAVTIVDGDGRPLRREVARHLIAPGALDEAPRKSRLIARATFIAPRPGPYGFALASTARAELRLDAQPPLVAKAGARPQDQRVTLAAGPHALVVEVPVVDAEGGLVLGVRPPGEPFRTHALGPPEVFASDGDRAPAPSIWLCRALPWLVGVGPPVAIALLVTLGLASIGARRRARLGGAIALAWRDEAIVRDAAILAAVAIALPMIAPLAAPGYYACHEEESYIVRLEELALALDGGVPLGRWWPDPVLGRGYPFLCFYAPLFYLLAAPLVRLGVDPVVALRLLSALLILVGAQAIRALGRRHASHAASLVAVALYVYSPYLHTDLWVRADLPETLGFVTFPLALVAIDRALDDRAPGGRAPGGRARVDVPLVGLAVGALGVTHAITSYFSLPFLAAWIVGRLGSSRVSPASLRRVFVGGLLGAVCTVFFAVPTLVERPLVRTDLLTTGYYSFARHATPLVRALVTPPPLGPYEMRLTLGVGLTLALGLSFGALGVLFARRAARRDPASRLLVPSLLAASLALVLVTPLGTPVLARVPLGRFVSFPWRLFLFASCALPLAAAGALDVLVPRRRTRAVVAAGAVAAIVVVALPWVGSPQILLRTHLHPVAFLRADPVDYVTSMNEYLPVAVRAQAPPFDDVADVAPASRATLRERERTPGAYRVRVDASGPVTVRWNAHEYPGWRAFVDGVPAPFERSAPDGLLRVAVPAGEHEVRIRFGRTKLRLACDLVSLSAVLACLAWLGRAWLARRDPR